jgi:hypothetical protein
MEATQMKTTLKKILAGALIAGTALAFGGCKDKKTNTNSEEIAKTGDTDKRIGAGNDLTDERNKDSLAAPSATATGDNRPQAPETAVTPPDNTEAGTNNPTGVATANDQAKGMEMQRSTAFGQAVNKDLKPSETTDPQAKREAAYGQAAERLSKLDARVSDIRLRVDGITDKSPFTDTLTDLRNLHESSQSAIDQIRDIDVKLDDAREAADRRMTEFESAINAVQKRVEKAASQT